MWNLLKRINKHLIIAIPAMMIAGFMFGLLADPGFLKSLIVPLTFLMVYPMMVTLKIKKVFEGGDLKAQVLTQCINFGIIPFAAYGLGVLFFRDQPYMALGLLLAGLLPTSGMTISWTGFAKGNMEAAVKMTVLGLTLGSLATPFYVRWLLGAAIEVNTPAVIQQIVAIVFVPMLAGYVTQQGLVRRYGMKGFQQQWAPRFPALSTIGVLGIVFAAMALKAKSIAAAPQMLLQILTPLLLIYAANYLLSTAVGRLALGRGDAIALVYGSVMRNLSIALAIAINAFGAQGSSAALVIAVAYIVQVQSAAWYVKLTDRLFGAPETPDSHAAAPAAGKPPLPVDSGPLVPAINRILYATDLSESARKAVRYACSIAHHHDADVTILHVVPDLLDALSEGAGVDLASGATPDVKQAFNDRQIEAAKQALAERIRETSRQVTREIPRCPLADGKIQVAVGQPTDCIVSAAEEGQYDLVIMGTHGYGKLAESVIGSVAAEVIHHCSVPVLVVHLN